MDIDLLRRTLTTCEGLKVLCFGDVMLDRYLIGDVKRISPEAPIPVLTQTAERTVLGAAGNVARNVSALGATAILVGVVGDDAAAHEATRLVAADGRIEGELIATRGRPTTVKTRLMSGAQQLLRVDHENTSALDAKTEAMVIEVLLDELARAHVVLISDYAKGTVTDEALATLVEAANAKSIPVLVDPKGRNFKRYGAVSVIKPNARELTELTGLVVHDEAHAPDALSAALGASQSAAILVTLGGRGMAYQRRDGSGAHIPADIRAVYDVSGAGDTALAALGLGLAAGLDLSDTARFAVLASGIVVEKIGAAVATPDEVMTAAEKRQMRAADKIQTLDRVLEHVARWRTQGLKIGFTNGCFDILHPGHTSLIAQAKAACDRLVVAINTDDSVRRLKGPTRPVNGVVARATVLAALGDVDCVTSFDADTPLGLIEAIKPDVLIKGSDYSRDQVVGADVVEAAGGQVVLVPLEIGHSTTGTLSRIAEGAS